MGDESNQNSSLSAAHNDMAAAAACMDENELLKAMSHLTEEERKSILDVMKRAECLDIQANQRSRYVPPFPTALLNLLH